jgi:hypothetical protein
MAHNGRVMKERKTLARRTANQHDPILDRRKNILGVCGAKKRNGDGLCQKPKGFGTSHPGIGKCKYHGGTGSPGAMHAAREQAVFMGAPKNINPIDAIMWCIRIAAGEVEWLSNRMQEIEQEEWYEFTPLGKQLHVLARERAAAQERLVKFSKDALQMGLAERAVRLAEMYGSSIAMLLRGIESELELTPKQRAIWPQVVRTQLALMQKANHSGIEIEDAEYTEIG